MYQLTTSQLRGLNFSDSESGAHLKNLIDSLIEVINSSYKNFTPEGKSQKESDENGNLISSTIDKLSEAKNKVLSHNFPTEKSDVEHSFNYKKDFAISAIEGFEMFVKTGLVVKK